MILIVVLFLGICQNSFADSDFEEMTEIPLIESENISEDSGEERITYGSAIQEGDALSYGVEETTPVEVNVEPSALSESEDDETVIEVEADYDPNDFISEKTGERVVSGVGVDSGLTYFENEWDGVYEGEIMALDGEESVMGYHYTFEINGESYEIQSEEDPMVPNIVDEGFYTKEEYERIREENTAKIRAVVEQKNAELQAQSVGRAAQNYTYAIEDGNLAPGLDYGGTIVRMFMKTLNGRPMYCIDPTKPAPGSANRFEQLTTQQNAVVCGIIAYGYCGFDTKEFKAATGIDMDFNTYKEVTDRVDITQDGNVYMTRTYRYPTGNLPVNGVSSNQRYKYADTAIALNQYLYDQKVASSSPEELAAYKVSANSQKLYSYAQSHQVNQQNYQLILTKLKAGSEGYQRLMGITLGGHKLTIEKYDRETGAPIAGVKFEVSSVGTFTTGADGKVDIPLWRNGAATNYPDTNDYFMLQTGITVKEIAPAGYIDRGLSANVTTQSGCREVLKFYNDKSKTRITMQKNDEKGQGLKGTKFKLYSCSQNHTHSASVTASGSCWKESIEKTTGESGKCFFDDLTAGEYRIIESKAVDGYVKLGGEIKVTITADAKGNLSVSAEAVGDMNVSVSGATLTVVNTPKMIRITMQKNNEKGEGLSGTKFKLYTCDQDHTHSNSATASNSCWKASVEKTTGASGKCFFDDLGVGEYRILETEATDGYIKQDGEIKLTIKLGSDGELKASMSKVGEIDASLKETVITVVNVPKTIRITMQKNDEKGEGLSGTKFKLYTCDQNHTHSNSATASNSCWKASVEKTTGSSGKCFFDDLEVGEYRILESKATDGYVKQNGEIKLIVSVASNGELTTSMTKVGEIDATLSGTTVTVVNTPMKTKVQVQKIGEAGSALPKAKYALYLCKEGHSNKDTVCDPKKSSCMQFISEKQVSDKDGTLVFEDLTIGEYRIIETKAPDGHTLPDGQVGVTVLLNTRGELEVQVRPLGNINLGQIRTVSDDVKHIQIINDEQTVDINLHKNDYDGNPISGTRFTLYQCRENHQHDEYVSNGSCYTEVVEKTTSGNGTLSFTGLKTGEYRIVETKAANGYLLPNGEIAVTVFVGEDGNVTSQIRQVGEIGMSVSGDTVTVLNQESPKLPNTGLNDPTNLLMMSGILLTLPAGLWFAYSFLKKKR